MAGAERAVNMALRVRGIGDVERDFKRVGRAGEEGFDRVEKAANGANKEVSEYTARLKRTAQAARAAFERSLTRDPKVLEQRLTDPEAFNRDLGRNRSSFVLGAVNLEKNAIAEGLPETTQGLNDLWQASEVAGPSIARMGVYGAAAAAGLKIAYEAVQASIEALVEHEAAVSRFEAEMSLMGNRSQATGDQIRALADEIVASTRQTEEATLQGARQLAQVQGLTVEAFEAGLEAAARYADAAGRELPDLIADQTVPVLQALANRDMPELLKATEGLDRAARVTILSLAEAGDTAGAQQALFDAYSQAADRASLSQSGVRDATDRLNDSWQNLKRSFGESIADEAAAGMDMLAGAVDVASRAVAYMEGKWGALLNILASPLPAPARSVLRAITSGGSAGSEVNRGPIGGRSSELLSQYANNLAEGRLRGFENKYGGGSNRPNRGGGSGGASDAQREAERLKREADSAQTAADRVNEANLSVIETYQRRAREAMEKIGLEGEALAALERKHEIEAAVRRINTEAIEKGVEARRLAAKVAGETFDEAAVIAEVTAEVEGQQEQVRRLARDYAESQREIAEFNQRQAEARALFEATRSPMEAFNEDLERYIQLLSKGAISTETFDRMMDRMAERLADIRYELDESAQAWAGYGDDVGQTLVDLAVNGGNLRDVLQDLLRMTLERSLQRTIGDPVAEFIDGLTGNNREENVANARDSLRDGQAILGRAVDLNPAAEGAALSLMAVQQQGYAAAQSLSALQASTSQTYLELAMQTDEAAAAMSGLVPATDELGLAFQQVMSMLTVPAGGGGNGFIGLAQLALGAAFGGGAAPQASLLGSVDATIASNPGLFSSGTDQVPTGKPFWVGENGRELMMKERSGNLRVMSNQEVRRGADRQRFNPKVEINVNVPSRADARKTRSSVARGTQLGLSRAARKNLASSENSW